MTHTHTHRVQFNEQECSTRKQGYRRTGVRWLLALQTTKSSCKQVSKIDRRQQQQRQLHKRLPSTVTKLRPRGTSFIRRRHRRVSSGFEYVHVAVGRSWPVAPACTQTQRARAYRAWTKQRLGHNQPKSQPPLKTRVSRFVHCVSYTLQ